MVDFLFLMMYMNENLFYKKHFFGPSKLTQDTVKCKAQLLVLALVLEMKDDGDR